MKTLLKSLKSLKSLKTENIIVICVIIISIVIILNTFYNSYKLPNDPNIESYINKNCKLNANFSNINASYFSQKTDGLYGCNNDITANIDGELHFYINSTVDVSHVLTDISINNNISTESLCGTIAKQYGSDLFYYNSTSNQCTLGNINYTTPASDTSVLYVICLTPTATTAISGYTHLGKGLFTKSGYDTMLANNFSKITEVNKYCLGNSIITDNLTDISSCINDASNNIEAIGICISTYGNNIIGEISGNYQSTWDEFKPFKVSSGTDNLQLDYNQDTSDYINDFSGANWTITEETKLKYDNDIASYETTKGEFENTQLAYTSSFFLYMFLTIVLIIAVILAILSMTNPDIVSIEIIIGYVLFISLITYFLYGRQRIETTVSNQLFRGNNSLANTLSKFAF